MATRSGWRGPSGEKAARYDANHIFRGVAGVPLNMHTERTYVRFLRYAVQSGFVLLTLFIGYRFYQFVQYFEVPGHPFVQRPAAVDAFLPIGRLATCHGDC
jgi:hypothetical protein